MIIMIMIMIMMMMITIIYKLIINQMPKFNFVSGTHT